MMLAQVTIPQFNTTVIHFPMLQNADATTLSIVAGSLIAIGALWCFLGFRLFRAYLGFIGMVIGAVVGVYVAAKSGILQFSIRNIAKMIISVFNLPALAILKSTLSFDSMV